MSAHSTLITTIASRISAQCANTKILQGFKWREYPIVEAIGIDDLPMVTFAGFSSESGQKDRDSAWFKVNIQIGVATKKTLGMAAHATACDKVYDAIFTTSTGTVDFALSRTSVFGVMDTIERTSADGIALVSVLGLTAETVPCKVGSQRS